MNDDVQRSRALISRRRALSLGGTVSLGALVAACTGSSTTTATTAPSSTTPLTPSSTASSDVIALLNQANTCTTAKEETQGPYWFDVDAIRSDVRDGRPGAELVLAVRAHDVSSCSNGSAPMPIANSVLEIWHCDAGGVYSGFESASGGGPGGGGGGGTSDGSYSSGDQEASPGDDGTYLRGAQVADANGIAQFTTIYPGWYRGRTVHIHLKLHVNRKTVVTTQLYFDEAVNDAVFATSPYDEHSGRDTRNSDDSIYDASGLVTVRRTGTGYLAVVNLGVDAA
jgi:protocatechuate 3,4-dioxygenase beta subunit